MLLENSHSPQRLSFILKWWSFYIVRHQSIVLLRTKLTLHNTGWTNNIASLPWPFSNKPSYQSFNQSINEVFSFDVLISVPSILLLAILYIFMMCSRHTWRQRKVVLSHQLVAGSCPPPYLKLHAPGLFHVQFPLLDLPTTLHGVQGIQHHVTSVCKGTQIWNN